MRSLPRPAAAARASGLARRAFCTRPLAAPEVPLTNPLANPFAKPGPWLGAYYSLREHDPAAMANREKRMDKAAPKRGRFIVAETERRDIEAIQQREPWRNFNRFDRGDVVETEYRPQDAASTEVTERVVGLVIAIHRRALGSSFRLLCRPDELPVEYQFQLFSPTLLGVEVRSKPKEKPRLAKLYYMRDRVGSLKFPRPSGGTGPKAKGGT
jgi:ribosomal protein L19